MLKEANIQVKIAKLESLIYWRDWARSYQSNSNGLNRIVIQNNRGWSVGVIGVNTKDGNVYVRFNFDTNVVRFSTVLEAVNYVESNQNRFPS